MNFLIIGNMRTFIYLFIIFVFSSCTDLADGETYTYTVRNESGVSIKVLAYHIYANELLYTTTLENGNEIKKTIKDGSPPRGYSFSVFFAGLNGRRAITDSIKVIYNNTKSKIFISEINCNGGFRNPLNTCVYSDTEENFVFTVEDYENAEDCNGDCE